MKIPADPSPLPPSTVSIHCAADLCRKTTWVSADTRSQSVYDLFEKDHKLFNVPVVDSQKLIGLINRDSFMRSMARRYHWELYSRKRCTKMMEELPLVVEADMPIRELAGRLLNPNEPERLTEGFIIVRQSKLVGTGLTSDVLAAILMLERQASDELRQHHDLLAELVEIRTHALETAQRNEAKQQAENLLAHGIIERLTVRHAWDDTQISHWMQPAEHFSGDTIASALASDGRRFVMLADATGHGLTAAISLVPVLTLFYRLVKENHPLECIVHEINRELLETMPPGRFVAASLVELDPHHGEVALWQGGMPDILHLDARGRLLEHFQAPQPPLGIIASDAALTATRHLRISPGERLVLFSDGLLEAENAAGEPFGLNRILKTMLRSSGQDAVDAIRQALIRHLGNAVAHDDITFLVIDNH